MTDVIEKKAKDALDEQAKQLSAQVSSSLRQARYSAIDSVSEVEKDRFSWGLGGFAVTAFVALLVLIWQPNSPLPAGNLLAIDDINLVLSDDEIELYEELDFITWLDEIEAAG